MGQNLNLSRLIDPSLSAVSKCISSMSEIDFAFVGNVSLKMKKCLAPVFLLASMLFSQFAVAVPAYFPVGPQTNVPEATVTGGGWTQCYSDLYSTNLASGTVLAACTGTELMLACRTTGNNTLQLLAAATRVDAIFDTGNNNNTVHTANGSGWYFSNAKRSWGFALAGDTVNKSSADVDNTGTVGDRLSWHIDQNAGGYRCGANTGLNGSGAFERIVYQSAMVANATPVPTLSEWGVIFLASLMGIFGIAATRRRQD